MAKLDTEHLVYIPIGSVSLEGALAIPPQAPGLVLFAHGSGSSRHSPRNNFVAQVLRSGGLGTLLFDLLTEEEDAVYRTRFDIRLLTKRLVEVTEWVMNQPEARNLRIGYFGASTGAAAALEAAAILGEKVGAVVSRGGRPDLAQASLHLVVTPTLMVVGELDHVVIQLNQQAYDQLKAEKRLEIIPGATHLFEEPGTLEKVAQVALRWFQRHLYFRG
jgi:pimeloyl-ACP methyl ester carboxylesterase